MPTTKPTPELEARQGLVRRNRSGPYPIGFDGSAGRSEPILTSAFVPPTRRLIPSSVLNQVRNVSVLATYPVLCHLALRLDLGGGQS